MDPVRKRWTHLDQMVGVGSIYADNVNDVTPAGEHAQVVSHSASETSMFVTKDMELAEWPVLQERFAELQLSLGAPENLALFHRNHAGYAVSTIAAAGVDLDQANALSPGGWSTVDLLGGDGWAVLVGKAGVDKRLRVQIGRA